MHSSNRSIASIFTILTAFVLLLCLGGCQKEVHIGLASSPPQLVVEGAIETGQYPYVFLTTTIGFFSEVSLATLQNSYVHNAVVTITTDASTITLREYGVDTAGGNKLYFYSIDTAALGTAIKGQEGKIYKLSIQYNGQTYESYTKIPYPKGVDSLWFGKPVFVRSSTPDSAYQLFADYTDPDTTGNYVRYFTRRNREPYYPSQIFSDEIVNGKKVKQIALQAGYQETETAKRDSLAYFYPGDTVTLKWCEIDKGVYTFWNTYQFANNAVGNPFASPINVTSNISNGAQGIWAGYGSISYTKVLPH